MPFPPAPSPSSASSPTIVTPDDLMDALARPTSDPYLLSGDDTSKMQVFLRNQGCWEGVYLESSPQPDDFSWEATHVDPDDHSLSRCSLLIHEVSLLVGLAPDDVYSSTHGTCSLVPAEPNQGPDILPLTLTPAKSLASRKHTTSAHAHPASATNQGHPPITPHPGNPMSTQFTDKAQPHPVTPTLRHKGADGVRPSLSPRRRQGQVFHLEQSFSDAPYRNAVYLDETFIHPREPPPKPTLDPPANWCSSVDRLERSLLKLEAYAPRNHRKSQSEERPPRVKQIDKRPSLPPPRRLKKVPSRNEITPRDASHSVHGQHLPDSPPVPTSMPAHQYVAPLICPAAPLNEDFTPGSFMDMDIPCTAEAQQASLRQLANKGKMKSLFRAAKTASRGVITWGKSLTGSTKSPVTSG